MEGFLLVPPDRGAIIGRAVWKPRYVILGSPIRRQQTNDSLSRSASSHRLQAARKGLISAPRPLGDESPSNTPGQMWLSIYKQKDDWEAVAQHHVPTIKSCEIQTIQYRKPGPALPTLVVTFNVDEVSDKSRKRRSSRAGVLSFKELFPNSILFRSAPDADHNIFDWQMALQPLIRSIAHMDTPMSPLSPISPPFSSFTNPFGSPASDVTHNSRPELHHRASSNTYNSSITYTSNNTYNSSIGTLPERQRSNTGTQMISPSPSLRSRRSDLSSQASSLNRPPGYQGSFPLQHTDLPSPASTAGYEDQLISGWTSAQGRSSTLSSHTRGSNSVSLAGTPPAPAQTILDRAFQMRMIPGSEKNAEDDAIKLSSIARFEALMRETDERIKAGKNSAKNSGKETRSPGWELEEEDEEDFSDHRPVTGESDSLYLEDEESEETNGKVVEPLAVSVHEIPTPAQRALEYIAGRSVTPLERPSSGQRPTSGRSNSGSLRSPTLTITSSDIPPPLPRSMTTDVSSFSRPSPPKRRSRPASMALPSCSTTFDDISPNASNTLKRRSSSSTKRLSFGEYAKRLSSASSLLLVQTTQSSSASSSLHESERLSGEYYDDEDLYGRDIAMHRGLSHSRLSGMSMQPVGSRESAIVESRDTKCGWRGSGFGAGAFSQQF